MKLDQIIPTGIVILGSGLLVICAGKIAYIFAMTAVLQ